MGHPEEKNVSFLPSNPISSWYIRSICRELGSMFEDGENWLKISSFVVQEADDDLLPADFAKGVQDLANCMAQSDYISSDHSRRVMSQRC